MRLKIGARQSDLARLQAYSVGDALEAKFPKLKIEYAFKASLGDKNLTNPLWKMPEKGVFTEDFIADLENGDVDMVVHSWKDLPTEHRESLEIAATLSRADLRDILFVRKDRVANLNGRLRVYSSSPRRAHNLTDFLKTHLPFGIKAVEFVSVRGNVPTRFKKFLSDDVDAFVMAKAAMDRLLSVERAEFGEVQNVLREQITKCLWMVLPIKINPPAAAQGALAIEILKSRSDLKDTLALINHESTFACVEEERKVLRSYGGGCHQKIGVAVVQKNFGKLRSLKGLTDQGKTLSEWSLNQHKNWKFKESEIWPLDPKESQFFDRVPMLQSQNLIGGRGIWVAKSEALPESWELSLDQLVWTSGLDTWEKLAARGVWVNGSAEGLGEVEDMQLGSLAPEAEWVKLSHSDAEDVSRFPMIANYKLIPKSNPPDLKGKKCFYWMSGSSFREALKKYPEILDAYHACGPGNTYQFLRKMIGNDSRIGIFLSYDSWKQEVTKWDDPLND